MSGSARVRVTKAEAEHLGNALGADNPAAVRLALAPVLARLVGGELSAGWDALIDRAGEAGRWPAARVASLRANDPPALEALAVDLIELRALT